MMTQEQLPLNIEGLEEYQLKLNATSPAWLKSLRQRSFAQSLDAGIPTVKDEEWKYTTLADVVKRRFQLAAHHQLISDQKFNIYRDKGDINIVLVNGVLWGDLSDLKHLPDGLTITSLKEACVTHGTEIQETMAKVTPNDTKAFLWLNQALFLDGVYIKVAKGVVIQPLVHIIHVTSGIPDDTIVFPQSFINVEDAAQVNLMESHVAFEPVTYLSNAVTNIKIAANAVVQYCKAQAESHQATHIGTTRIWQEKGSSLDSFNFAHGAQMARNNLSILLKGEGANTILNGFYALDGTQHLDNHTLLDIQQPNCTSYQLYKGLLNNASRAIFNGKIYVHSIAQKTNGYQLNKHLLLGKDARVDTKPQLEIFADDVKCTHGATIGQLSDDEIFYLQSRCINQQTAIQLLSKGFIDDIINTIKSESIRLKLHRLMAKKFPEVKL